MEPTKAKVSLGMFDVGDQEDRTARIYLGANVYMEVVLPQGTTIDGIGNVELFVEVPLAQT